MIAAHRDTPRTEVPGAGAAAGRSMRLHGLPDLVRLAPIVQEVPGPPAARR